MNVLIIADSFILKESIAAIFRRVYEESIIKTTENIDNLSKDEINLYDIILFSIVNNDFELLNEVIKLKSDKNRIVILNQLKNKNILKLCIEKNIDGYIVDFDDEYEFKYIINKIMSKKKFYDPEVIQKIIGNKNKSTITQSILTSREEEVILEVKKGLSNKEIADKLEVTEFTIKKHLSSILKKLNFRNRKDIIINSKSE